MLPQLAANAGYIDRSNINEVLSPVSGQVSTAEDQRRRVGDLQLSWNLLDFGISYYMSKQKADDLLIAQEARRKMIQQLAKETRESFWRAYALQKYNYVAPRFQRSLRQAIRQSREGQSQELIKPIEAAEYRRDLWETASKIQFVKSNLSDARPTLMGLIQAPTSQRNIRLITTKEEHRSLPKGLPRSVTKLKELALLKRPELRQETYEKRITLNDVNKAKWELLPNPSINYGFVESLKI